VSESQVRLCDDVKLPVICWSRHPDLDTRPAEDGLSDWRALSELGAKSEAESPPAEPAMVGFEESCRTAPQGLDLPQAAICNAGLLEKAPELLARLTVQQTAACGGSGLAESSVFKS